MKDHVVPECTGPKEGSGHIQVNPPTINPLTGIKLDDKETFPRRVTIFVPGYIYAKAAKMIKNLPCRCYSTQDSALYL